MPSWGVTPGGGGSGDTDGTDTGGTDAGDTEPDGGDTTGGAPAPDSDGGGDGILDGGGSSGGGQSYNPNPDEHVNRPPSGGGAGGSTGGTADDDGGLLDGGDSSGGGQSYNPNPDEHVNRPPSDGHSGRDPTTVGNVGGGAGTGIVRDSGDPRTNPVRPSRPPERSDPSPEVAPSGPPQRERAGAMSAAGQLPDAQGDEVQIGRELRRRRVQQAVERYDGQYERGDFRIVLQDGQTMAVPTRRAQAERFAEERAEESEVFGEADFDVSFDEDNGRLVAEPTEFALRRRAAGDIEGADVEDVRVTGSGSNRVVELTEAGQRAFVAAQSEEFDEADIASVEETDEGLQPVLTDAAIEERAVDQALADLQVVEQPVRGPTPGEGVPRGDLSEEDLDVSVTDEGAEVSFSETFQREQIAADVPGIEEDDVVLDREGDGVSLDRQATVEQAFGAEDPEPGAIAQFIESGGSELREQYPAASAGLTALSTSLRTEEGIDPEGPGRLPGQRDIDRATQTLDPGAEWVDDQIGAFTQTVGTPGRVAAEEFSEQTGVGGFQTAQQAGQTGVRWGLETLNPVAATRDAITLADFEVRAVDTATREGGAEEVQTAINIGEGIGELAVEEGPGYIEETARERPADLLAAPVALGTMALAPTAAGTAAIRGAGAAGRVGVRGARGATRVGETSLSMAQRTGRRIARSDRRPRVDVETDPAAGFLEFDLPEATGTLPEYGTDAVSRAVRGGAARTQRGARRAAEALPDPPFVRERTTPIRGFDVDAEGPGERVIRGALEDFDLDTVRRRARITERVDAALPDPPFVEPRTTPIRGFDVDVDGPGERVIRGFLADRSLRDFDLDLGRIRRRARVTERVDAALPDPPFVEPRTTPIRGFDADAEGPGERVIRGALEDLDYDTLRGRAPSLPESAFLADTGTGRVSVPRGSPAPTVRGRVPSLPSVEEVSSRVSEMSFDDLVAGRGPSLPESEFLADTATGRLTVPRGSGASAVRDRVPSLPSLPESEFLADTGTGRVSVPRGSPAPTVRGRVPSLPSVETLRPDTGLDDLRDLTVRVDLTGSARAGTRTVDVEDLEGPGEAAGVPRFTEFDADDYTPGGSLDPSVTRESPVRTGGQLAVRRGEQRMRPQVSDVDTTRRLDELDDAAATGSRGWLSGGSAATAGGLRGLLDAAQAPSIDDDELTVTEPGLGERASLTPQGVGDLQVTGPTGAQRGASDTSQMLETALQMDLAGAGTPTGQGRGRPGRPRGGFLWPDTELDDGPEGPPERLAGTETYESGLGDLDDILGASPSWPDDDEGGLWG